jgi:hypothetical protein
MILQVTKILLAALYCPALSLTLPCYDGPEVKLLHTRVDKNDDVRPMLLSVIIIAPPVAR